MEPNTQIIERKSAIANKILNYFIGKGIKTEFEFYPDKDDYMNFQFNFKVDGINDFAIFFGCRSNDVDIASVYEFLTPITKEGYLSYKEEFNQNKACFSDLLALSNELDNDDLITEVHAYNTFKTEDFTTEVLDSIYDFLLNKNDFFKELAKVSEKFNYQTKETI